MSNSPTTPPDSPTTPPYSGAQSSSTTAPPRQYVLPETVIASATQENESRFNTSDWAIMGVGMILTGIIGYFSSLIAVKTDIAENRKDISVASEQINHISQGLDDAKRELSDMNVLQRTSDVLEVRVASLEKDLEEHSNHSSSKNRITNQASGTP